MLTLILILANLFAIYFFGYFVLNILFFVYFLVGFTREKLRETPSKMPKISIIVPAYNEEKTICDSLDSLVQLDYPDFEIIVVNDGSTDDTLAILNTKLDLVRTEITTPTSEIITAPIRNLYQSRKLPNIIVVDKENGGKADALNAGINFASGEYIVTIDADTLLDRRSLRRIATVFDNKDVLATGGLITVANDTEVKNGIPVDVPMPRNPLVMFQLVEYLVSYSVGRWALSHFNVLLILSGAFSAFRKGALLAVKGFLSRYHHGRFTVCEDIEIILRLHRYFRERGHPAKIQFYPFPIAWTEVPQTITSLARQRNRWHRGLGESLLLHKTVLFDPRYGRLGLFATPYYLMFEFLSPFVKLAATIFLVWLMLLGKLDVRFAVYLLIFVALLAGTITATVTTLVEARTRTVSKVNLEAMRYKGWRDWLKLVGFSFLSPFIYHPLINVFQLWGTYDFIRRKRGWYKFKRIGFGRTHHAS